jgi:hypothetical protein
VVAPALLTLEPAFVAGFEALFAERVLAGL